ncbi:MAG: ribonuclease D [Deltaproteobacteria bacterium]|nr:MAG: ribonuclease D [Deltaproteobacteria bacterium]
MSDYTLIDSSAALKELAAILLTEKVVAFDTEADSFYHYFDKVCLLQIATRKHVYLIDPLALDDPKGLRPLGAVFAAKNIRKIFHAAEYDIYVLKRECSFRFANLFDTAICAQLLGYPSIGLAALGQRHFEVMLPKDEQRSDWSRRPLTEQQLRYAVADVVYLIPLAEKLERELDRAGRMAWAEEEFAAVCRREWPPREFDKLGYLRIKGARSLDPQALSILRELYLMRDKRAREADRPAFKVLGNRTMIEIAEQQPDTLEQLRKIKGVTDLILRRLGRDVMAALARGGKKRHGPLPKAPGSGKRRMDRATERRLAVLKRWRATRAAELALDPGVFCPNSALEAIAGRHPQNARELSELELKGWFRRDFGAEVLQTLAEAEPDPEGSSAP